MRTVYACRLELADAAGATVRTARALTRAWIGRAYGGWPEGAPARWEPVPGVSVAWRLLDDDRSDATLAQYTWRRPHERDASLRRASVVLIGEHDSLAWVSVREQLESVDPTLVEVSLETPATPAIVTEIVARLGCVDGGWPLSAIAREVDASESLGVDAFLRGGRILPALVISPTAAGRILADADALGARLTGLVHVVVLRDGAAAAALAEELGSRLGVADGEARLYWPRLRSTDDQGRHRRWRAEELDEAGHPRPATTAAIARVVIDAAALRMSDPPLMERLEAAAARRRLRELEAQRAEAATASTPVTPALSDADLEAWEHDLAELERLTDRVADLEEERRRLLDQYALVAGEAPRASLLDVVNRARGELRNLAVTERARQTAARWQFDRPDLLWEQLSILDDLAGEWANGRLNGSFGDVARGRGLNWASGVSESAEQKHAVDYRCSYDGRVVELGPHLKLGGNRNLLRVYCCLDRPTRRVVVGHVGGHLPDRTT